MGQGRDRITDFNPEPLESMPDYDIAADSVSKNLRTGSVIFNKQTKRKPNLNKIFYKATEFYDPKDLPTTAKMTTQICRDSLENNERHTKTSQVSRNTRVSTGNSTKSANPATIWYRDWERIDVPNYEKLAHHQRTDRSYVSIRH